MRLRMFETWIPESEYQVPDNVNKKAKLSINALSNDLFEIKLTFEMLTVRRQQHLFPTHELMILWKC